MKRTLRRDIFLVLLLGLLTPLILGTYLYSSKMQNIIKGNLIVYQRQIVDQTAEKISSIFTSLRLIQHPLIASIADSDYFSHREQLSEKERVQKVVQIIETAKIYNQTSPYISGIYIIDNDGHVYTSKDSIDHDALMSQPFISTIRINNQREIISTPHIADYASGLSSSVKPYVISVIRRIQTIANPNNNIYLLIDLYADSFISLLENVAQESAIPLSLKLSDGTVLLSNTLYDTVIEQTASIVDTPKNRINDQVTLHSILREKQIGIIVRNTLFGSWVFGFILIIISFLAATFFSRRITQPLEQLRSAMEQVGKGDFNPNYPQIEYEDIKFLENGFRSMVKEIDTLMNEAILREKETREAELQSLQARVNPHFLYNTMDVMRGMAVSMGHTELAEMAHSLSRLFRYSIQGGGSELVSLKDELNALEDYIHIQRVRFGERIRYINSIPEQFLSAQVMKLTIQPIIENAFVHGLQSRDGEGVVSIDARQEGDDLRIVVEDTGEGMHPEKIAALNRILSEDPNPDNLWRYGGIENVNLRMKIVYGKRYGITVEAADTKGTRIVLTIPLRDINHV